LKWEQVLSDDRKELKRKVDVIQQEVMENKA
jgi:hypothetical protein